MLPVAYVVTCISQTESSSGVTIERGGSQRREEREGRIGLPKFKNGCPSTLVPGLKA